eukprot:c15389_g1_i1.p1 GENE.c15389_g1_i1~~c15389_g1_i1.p1  ORF type:complete len:153 (-),score=15.55 c15389_g1_i1:38-496(-)
MLGVAAPLLFLGQYALLSFVASVCAMVILIGVRLVSVQLSQPTTSMTSDLNKRRLHHFRSVFLMLAVSCTIYILTCFSYVAMQIRGKQKQDSRFLGLGAAISVFLQHVALLGGVVSIGRATVKIIELRNIAQGHTSRVVFFHSELNLLQGQI